MRMSVEKFVLAIDQGTTSSRAIIFNHSGEIVSVGQKEFTQIFPNPGWVEHDPVEIWESVRAVVAEALQKAEINGEQLAAVGITNQRETTIVWDKNTGEPVYNALVWQDTRTAPIVREVAAGDPLGTERYRQITGENISTYPSAPRITWILDNVEGAREKAEAGDLQAATFGQACFEKGTAKNTYGTGCFMLMNTGEEPIFSNNGLLTTLLYKLGDEKPVYALEGSIAVAGSLVQWVRDNLGMIEKSSDIQALAETVEDNGGVYFVPAFSGLFAPYWKDDARGAIVGLTRYVTKAHIARAVEESTAFQSAEVLDAMNADAGVPLKELKVDGGMTRDDLVMQFQADLCGVDVIRPVVAETTALGAAYAAGIAVGFWNGTEDVIANWQEDKRWTPSMDAAERDRTYRLWKKAVTRTYDWVDEDVK